MSYLRYLCLFANITEILLKVALNTIKQKIAEKQHTFMVFDLTRVGIIPTISGWAFTNEVTAESIKYSSKSEYHNNF
jgi:hypothetical protein